MSVSVATMSMSVCGVLREILQEKCTGILESSRRTELKKRTEEILDKSCGCETLLDTFSVTITAFLQDKTMGAISPIEN